jgi:hypothetical protein
MCGVGKEKNLPGNLQISTKWDTFKGFWKRAVLQSANLVKKSFVKIHSFSRPEKLTHQYVS